MIKANDLRVGNWVEEEILGKVKIAEVHQQSVRVETINMKTDRSTEIILYSLGVENIKPIPLRPEILEKCGFKVYPASPTLMQLEYKNDHWICKRNNGFAYLAFDLESYVEVELTHLEDLHQLQNLYHSLTGEELNYKP